MNKEHDNVSKQGSVLEEPKPVCSICGKPISAIIEAIREPEGTYTHFDCVLNKITNQYDVKSPDKVSYVGQGCFAIVSKGEDGHFFFKKKIQYESPDTFSSMKQYVENSKK